MKRARKLATRSVEKVWGRTDLPPPFSRVAEEPVGEIWFEPDAAMPGVLAKYLFTSANLSVQVHPRDGEAGPGTAGKDECWLILDAKPGARLAAGFREPIDAEAMRAAALDGSIEDLIAWHEIQAGDFFYLPAGTVHAIGAGISLVEVQRSTDITYRLYDYGRPRELHLDDALRVADGSPYDPRYRKALNPSVETQLVGGPYFMLFHCVGAPSHRVISTLDGQPCQILPLSGEVQVGGMAIAPGESALVVRGDRFDMADGTRYLLAAECG